MFERILLPVDRSSSAMQAADLVARMVSQSEAAVTVVVVVSPLDPAEGDYRTELLEQHNAWLRREAKTTADRVVERLPPECRCATKILEGRPVSAMLAREVQAGGYDLVVMGSRGLSQDEDHLRYVGSVTEHLLRRVSTPVLVVPFGDDSINDDE